MRPTPATTDKVDDSELVRRAVDGEKAALAALVGRHQTFVFNVALKMFGDRADAEDLTQEVLVKVVTSLRSYRGDAAFRTWLYRIAVNHFLQTRRRGMELAVGDFASYFDALDRMPDAVDLAFEPEPDGDQRPLAGSTVAELRVRCTTGMLMCLDRDQRVTLILGASTGITRAAVTARPAPRRTRRGRPVTPGVHARLRVPHRRHRRAARRRGHGHGR